MTIDLSWLGPTASAAGGVIVASIAGASMLWRRRTAAKEKATPSPKDEWSETRSARAEASKYYSLYRTFEDLFYAVHSALRTMAKASHDAHPDQVIPDEVVKALALRPPAEPPGP